MLPNIQQKLKRQRQSLPRACRQRILRRLFEQDKLNDELKKLSNSLVVKSETKSTMKHKGRVIEWPWHIRCGICHNEQLLEAGRSTEGRLKKFKAAHYEHCKKQHDKKEKERSKQLKVDLFLKCKSSEEQSLNAKKKAKSAAIHVLPVLLSSSTD